MKRGIAIILLFIYGYTSVGATIHIHYCMDEYAGWSIWHSDKDSKCDKCGMQEEKGGCCKDEHKVLKIDADQNQVKVKAPENQKAFELIFNDHYFGYLFTPSAGDIVRPQINAPPTKSDVPIYILHRVFRI